MISSIKAQPSCVEMLFRRSTQAVQVEMPSANEEDYYIKILKAVGVEFSDEKMLLTTKQKCVGYFIAISHMIGIALMSNFCEQNRRELTVLVPAFSCIIITLLANVKCVAFFMQKEDFFNLMKRLKSLPQLGKT